MNQKLKDIFKDRTLTKYSMFIVVTVFLIYVMYFLMSNITQVTAIVGKGFNSVTSTLSPLFVGLVIAYFLNPMVGTIDKKILSRLIKEHKDPAKEIKRKKSRRIFAVVLSYIIVIAAVIAIIYGFSAMILGQVVFANITDMAKSLFKYFSSFEDTLKGWINSLPVGGGITGKINGWLNSMITWVGSSINSDNIISTTKSVVSSVTNLVIGIIISIYLSYDKDFFIRVWKGLVSLLFPPKVASGINVTLNEINGVLSRFLRGVLLDATIVAILTSIGLTILGLKFAVFLGIFAGIANVIPYFGPIIGMVPAFFVGLLTDGFKEGLIAVIILLVVQQIDGNLIYPKVVGGTTGLHPLFVLLAVLIGGGYGGLIGMIIAVPTAGVVQLFVGKWITHRENKLNIIIKSKAKDEENKDVDGKSA